MALVVKRKKGQSQQQMIGEFKRLTFNDPGLEKVKETAQQGYVGKSRRKHEKKKELQKEFDKLRRRHKRATGRTK